MLDAGMSQRQVAASFNVHHRTIGRLQEWYNVTGSVNDRQRTGQPRVTTLRQDHVLVVNHLRDRFLSAAATARNTQGLRGQVSAPTIRMR